MNMPANLPMLSGYRVLDITQIVAGPTCGRVLAEMGAEVIKVEPGPHGDRGRAAGLKPRDPRYKGSSQSTYFFQHNHSKKSLALDFKSEQAREIIRRLAARVDVVVENFSPGVMARAGHSYDRLREKNQGLIMCSISMAGQSGPLSGLPGYDYMAAAYAGVTSTLGEADRPPSQITLAMGDSYTGIAAAMAIGFALLQRERTGEGQYIESALIDAYFHMQEVNVPRVSLQGDAYVPRRAGSLHPEGGPTGVFRYRDGEYVSIMVLPHQWQQLVEALGQPELRDDPRFNTPSARRKNNEVLRDIIEEWLGRFPSREMAVAALAAERVPCAPVLTLNEAMALAHVRERGTVRRVRDRHIGEFDIPGLPVRFSRWPAPRNLHAALLGEHNELVLREVGGLTNAEICSLYEDRVLVRDPLADGRSNDENR
jgi:crotonobetainyl-CoA:carnitine CoA-transferase CaiB-like acyl-CoA transferase